VNFSVTSRNMLASTCAAATALVLVASAPQVVAQAPAGQSPSGGPAAGGARGSQGQAAGPAAQAGRGRGGGVFPETEPDDNAGFVSIFDGKTLDGWDGDTRFWRVENGEIVGETTPENVVKQNNFLIWRGGTVRDFELKVEFRISGTNSGIQYRSAEVPAIGKWVLKGYQADIDFAGQYVGNVHDERGRGPGEGHVVLSKRGEVTRIVEGPKYKVVGTIADATLLRGVVNVNGWNRYHIIARGPVLLQFINGQLMAVALDEDTQHSAAEGLIGFQMHTGPPFKVEYRNILYRKL
jgi:3-keto-disaccharide hydrolase